MLIECSHCGAPLDVTPQQRMANCDYCRRSNEVLRANRLRPETPADWQAPATWTAPTGEVLRRHAHRAVRMVVGVGIAIAALAIGTAAGIGLLVQQTVQQATAPPEVALPAGLPAGFPSLPGILQGDDPTDWTGTRSLVCGPNQRLEIEGKTIQGADLADPLVDASGPNCEVVIRNSTLRGRTIIAGPMNLRVTVENSTLDGEDVAIETASNGRVELRGGSRVHGGRAGVTGNANLTVRVDGPGELTSDGAAVEGEINLEVSLRNGTIAGGERGIVGDVNAELDLRGGVLRGEDAAIDLRLNGEVDVEGTRIEGPVRAGRNAEVRGL